MNMCLLIPSLCFFVQAGMTVMADDLRRHKHGKLIRRNSPRKQISEVMEDGEVIHSEVRANTKSQTTVVREVGHVQRVVSHDRAEKITSDGRVLPASFGMLNTSLEDDAIIAGNERRVCCMLGSTCDQCSLGAAQDDHVCASTGNMRCRYKHEHDKDPGNCCTPDSSCKFCPDGNKPDTACVHAGSYRCKPAEPDASKAGECCSPGASCTKCPHGSQPDNLGCALKGNNRCITNDDCWFKCGWDGYCMACDTPTNQNRVCCRKGYPSPMCDRVPESQKLADRHTCIDAPPADGSSWVTRLKYTALGQNHKKIGIMTRSWLSWMNKLVYVNTKYGPGTLTDMHLDRIRINVDGPLVTIEISGLMFKITAEGWYSFFKISASGKIHVAAPRPGDLIVKLKLPNSHNHKDKNGNVVIRSMEFVDTLDLQGHLKLRWFPPAGITKFINMLKDEAKDSLVNLANAHISEAATRAVRILEAQKPAKNKTVPGLTSVGDCCSNNGRCHMCPFGFERDRSKCWLKGGYRCLEQPRTELVGKCCNLGTSCNPCPHGAYADTTCAADGSMRCRSVPYCFKKCGDEAGWCLACDKGFACCSAEHLETGPSECQNAHIKFPKEGYQCAKVSSGQPFLGSLRFYVAEQVTEAGLVDIVVGRLAIGQFDLSRLRVDVIDDGISVMFADPKVAVSGTYGVSTFLVSHSSTFYAKALPGGHGGVTAKVNLKADGTYNSTTYHDCRLDIDFALKIQHSLVGPIVQVIMTALRSFITKNINEKICGLVKQVLDGDF